MQTRHPPAFPLCRPLAGAVLALIALAAHVLADEAHTGEQIFRAKCAVLSRHVGGRGEGPLRQAPKRRSFRGPARPSDRRDHAQGRSRNLRRRRRRQGRRLRPRRLLLQNGRRPDRAVAPDGSPAPECRRRPYSQLPPPARWDDQRGLRGEYFGNRNFGDRALERLDTDLHFDFKSNSPDAKIKPEEFSIRWQGSVLAPETGDYEFILKTENGVRLWVNDQAHPLIDGWVRSGVGVEERGTIRLLAGRAYPLKLEFFKSKEAKEKTAAISLEWKPPTGVAGPIPPANLSPNRFPETLVISAAFPPDDRSLGWERGNTVSKAWDQAATDAAVETAGYVIAHLRELSDVRNDAADRGPKLREFCRRFVERAFRRPLTDEQKHLYIDHLFDAAPNPDTAVKRVVLLALLSPRFLYREVGDLLTLSLKGG